MKKWWGSLVDGAARAMGVPSTTTETKVAVRPAKKAGKKAGKKARRAMGAAEVRALEQQGLARVEIARRTGLSQDMVGMLLNLSPERPAESAASGTFFRILEARMAS